MTASTATPLTPKSARTQSGVQPCIKKHCRAVEYFDKVSAPKFKEHREASDLTIDAKALKPSKVESIIARLSQRTEDREKDQSSIKKQVSTLRDPCIPDVLQQEHGGNGAAERWSFPEFYHRVVSVGHDGAFDRDALHQLLRRELVFTASRMSSAKDFKGEVISEFTGAMMCGAVIVHETRPGEAWYASHRGIVVKDNVDEYIDAVMDEAARLENQIALSRCVGAPHNYNN
jgi:hypothetical protein